MLTIEHNLESLKSCFSYHQKEQSETDKFSKIINTIDTFFEPRLFGSPKNKLVKLISKEISKKNINLPQEIKTIIEFELDVLKNYDYDESISERIKIENEKRRIFMIPISDIRFPQKTKHQQDYVLSETVEEKKKIISQNLQPTNLKYFQGQLIWDGYSDNYSLTLPVEVQRIIGTNLFNVYNGFHTIYAFYQLGITEIQAKHKSIPYTQNTNQLIDVAKLRLNHPSTTINSTIKTPNLINIIRSTSQSKFSF